MSKGVWVAGLPEPLMLFAPQTGDQLGGQKLQASIQHFGMRRTRCRGTTRRASNACVLPVPTQRRQDGSAMSVLFQATEYSEPSKNRFRKQSDMSGFGFIDAPAFCGQ